MSNDTTKTVEQQLADLQAENARLKEAAAKKSTMSFKVSEKGAVSVYGLGRFPVTLYAQQMERLLGAAPEIIAFIAANKGRLATKE
jgi:hypothetical protein